MTNTRHLRTRRPWHLWLLGSVFLGLYLIGATDYWLVLVNDTGYIGTNFGQPGIDYFDGYPLGLRLMWSVNIVAGLFAALLLLARNRAAAPLALTATVAQGGLLMVTFALCGRWEALGAWSSLTDIAVGAVTALFSLYCYWSRSRGLLR